MSDHAEQVNPLGQAPADHETPRDHLPPFEAEIVHELTGSLRCVSCRYELQGLSIKGNCPECGLPVRATLLSMVDPDALELQPVRRPRLVVAGMLVWAFGALLALVLALVVWLSLAFDGFTPGTRQRVVMAGALALVASGVGAIAAVRPHAGIPRRRVLLASLGVLSYPIAVKLYADVGLHATPGAGADRLSAWAAGTDALLWRAERLGLWLLLALGAALLRPSFRQLAARSLVLRSKRVDRQVIAATIAAMLIAALGDAIGLSVGLLGDWAGSALLLAEALVGLGVVLLLLGLIGAAIDTVRIAPAVLQPPLALADVLPDGGAPK